MQLPLFQDSVIRLSAVVGKLGELGYRLGNVIFLYYSRSSNMYVHWGKTSAVEDAFLPLGEVKDKLILKLRRATEPQEAPLAEMSKENAIGRTKPEDKKEVSKRNKERKIEYIIEKVSEWRKLYTGSLDADGKIVKLSLDDAAKKVGIAKKTLDDYLLQLRAGRKYGFDFNTHKEDKVGVLRAFVKAQKKAKKAGKEIEENSDGGQGAGNFGF